MNLKIKLGLDKCVPALLPIGFITVLVFGFTTSIHILFVRDLALALPNITDPNSINQNLPSYAAGYSAITYVYNDIFLFFNVLLTGYLLMFQMIQKKDSDRKYTEEVTKGKEILRQSKIDREKSEALGLQKMIDDKTHNLSFLDKNGGACFHLVSENFQKVVGCWRTQAQISSEYHEKEVLSFMESCLPILGLVRLQLHQAEKYEPEAFEFVYNLRENAYPAIEMNLPFFDAPLYGFDNDIIGNNATRLFIELWLSTIAMYRESETSFKAYFDKLELTIKCDHHGLNK